MFQRPTSAPRTWICFAGSEHGEVVAGAPLLDRDQARIRAEARDIGCLAIGLPRKVKPGLAVADALVGGGTHHALDLGRGGAGREATAVEARAARKDQDRNCRQQKFHAHLLKLVRWPAPSRGISGSSI